MDLETCNAFSVGVDPPGKPFDINIKSLQGSNGGGRMHDDSVDCTLNPLINNVLETAKRKKRLNSGFRRDKPISQIGLCPQVGMNMKNI